MTRILVVTDLTEKLFYKKVAKFYSSNFIWEIRPPSGNSFSNSDHFDVILLSLADAIYYKLLLDDLNIHQINTPIIALLNESNFKNIHSKMSDFITEGATKEEFNGRVNFNIAKHSLINLKESNSEQTANQNNPNTKQLDQTSQYQTVKIEKVPLGIICGKLHYNASAYGIIDDKTPIDLSYKEFELLNFLITNTDIVFTREEILDNLWSEETYSSSRLIDVHIRRIRAKLGKYASHIKSQRGRGYCWLKEI